MLIIILKLLNSILIECIIKISEISELSLLLQCTCIWMRIGLYQKNIVFQHISGSTWLALSNRILNGIKSKAPSTSRLQKKTWEPLIGAELGNIMRKGSSHRSAPIRNKSKLICRTVIARALIKYVILHDLRKSHRNCN